MCNKTEYQLSYDDFWFQNYKEVIQGKTDSCERSLPSLYEQA